MPFPVVVAGGCVGSVSSDSLGSFSPQRAMSSPSSSSPQQHDGAAGNASASTSSRSAASPSAASSSASGRGRGKALADARVSEELEIALNLALERFWYSDDQGGAAAQPRALGWVAASCPRGAGAGLPVVALASRAGAMS